MDECKEKVNYLREEKKIIEDKLDKIKKQFKESENQ
jgi:hypothetical protein